MSQGADTAGAEGSVTVHRDGAVLLVTLDRPSRRNSLTQLMIGMLVEALTDAAAYYLLRAVHLRSAGDHFCAGADWVAANHPGAQRPCTGDLVRRIPHAAHRVIQPALKASSCRWCAACGVGPWDSAAISPWPVTSRWPPRMRSSGSPSSTVDSARTPASTWLLPRLAGLARARRMLLLGEKVSAARCDRLGTDPPDGERPGPRPHRPRSWWAGRPPGRRPRSAWPSRR